MFDFIPKELLTNDVFVGAVGAGGVGAIAAGVWRYGDNVARWVLGRISINIGVNTSKSSTVFECIDAWISETKYAKSRARRLQLTRRGRDYYDEENGGEQLGKKMFFTIGYGNHIFWERGKLYMVSRSLKENAGSTPIGEMSVRILFGTRADVERISNAGFRTITNANSGLKIRMYTNGGWSSSDSKTERFLSTIDLPGSMKEEILADARRFFESRAIYINRGQPWRRGYLFYGPPGTGKSSMIAALATELNTTVYYLSLASVQNDTVLAEELLNIPARSILAIEDIDTFNVAGKREGSNNKKDASSTLTLSGLLNSLDGLVASEGRLLIMTSNDVGALDQALVRPGRVDRKFHFGLSGWEQIASMMKRFYGTDAGHERFIGTQPVPASLIQSVFERNPDDVTTGINEALLAITEYKP